MRKTLTTVVEGLCIALVIGVLGSGCKETTTEKITEVAPASAPSVTVNVNNPPPAAASAALPLLTERSSESTTHTETNHNAGPGNSTTTQESTTEKTTH